MVSSISQWEPLEYSMAEIVSLVLRKTNSDFGRTQIEFSSKTSHPLR